MRGSLSMFHSTIRGGVDMERRRPLQRGYLYRKGPSWMLQWREDVRTEDGRILRKKFKARIAPAAGPGAVSRREAERIAWREILARLNQASLFPASLATVREFWEQRFLREVVANLKPAGQKHYDWCATHILAHLGELRLREVTHEHVSRMIRAVIESGRSVQTAVHLRNAVSALFRHATVVGAYSGPNPAQGVRTPPMRRKEKPALTWEQFARLMMAYPSPVREMVYLAAMTSLNVAEMLGLRWRDLNLTDEPAVRDSELLPPYSLRVRGQYYRGQFCTPKTSSRRRIVPLTPQLVRMLTEWQQMTPFRGEDDLVFANRRGRPHSDTLLARRVLRPIAQKVLGVDWVSWHVFRHTTATWTEAVGMPLSERRALMGHARVGMTLDYTRDDIERRRQYLERIENQIRSRVQ